MAAGRCWVRYRPILLAASLGLVACQVSQTAQTPPTEPKQAEPAVPDTTGRYDSVASRTQTVPGTGDQPTESAAPQPEPATETPRLQPASVPATDAEASPPDRPAVRSTAQRGEPRRFYDVSSPAYGLLQQANDALAGFPVDRIGAIDWMRALGDGLIAPRVNVQGTATMDILDQDVIMENTREMPHVQFPHRSHTQWLACNNCHDSIFIEKKGANPMTMNDIFLGKYCGVCHDKVAFSTYACERCHSVPITVNP